MNTLLKGDVFISRYVDDDNEIWKRVNISIQDCSSDAEWVKESAKLNMGRSISGSSLSSILSNQANAAANASNNTSSLPGSGGAIEGDTSFKQIDGETCVWTQTPDDIEGISSLPDVKITKKDIKVKFLKQRLEVTILNTPDINLTGDLGGIIDIDGSTWNFDGNGNIVVSMEKQEAGSEWPFALRQD